MNQLIDLLFYNTIANKANNFNFSFKNLDTIMLFLMNGPLFIFLKAKISDKLGQKKIVRTISPQWTGLQIK